MKKQFLLCAASVFLFVTACSSGQPQPSSSSAPLQSQSSEDTSQTEEALAGGWQLMEDETVTEELQAVFDKAVDGLTGVGYTPYVCLARQVVAGTNYALLCRAVTVTAQPEAYYAVVYIYEDLKGNTEILDIVRLEFAGDAEKDGTWEVSESPEIYNELTLVFTRAMEGFTGSDLVPCAYLGWKVADGTDYALLCRKTIVVPDGETSWAVVKVREEPDGSAKISDIQELDIRIPEKKD